MNKISEFFFDILGVNRKSSKDDIKKAFRDKIKQWHPDKFPEDSTNYIEALEKSKLINEAYYILKNYEPPNVRSSDAYYPHYSKSNRQKGEPDIVRIRVKSSNVHSIGYDNEKEILQVEFLNGSVYEYYEVPEIIFNEFMAATSKGKYGNRYIFYSYHYQKVK